MNPRLWISRLDPCQSKKRLIMILTGWLSSYWNEYYRSSSEIGFEGILNFRVIESLYFLTRFFSSCLRIFTKRFDRMIVRCARFIWYETRLKVELEWARGRSADWKWRVSVLEKHYRKVSVGQARKMEKRAVETWCFSYGFDYLVFRKFAFFQTWRPINPFKTELDNIFHAFKRTSRHSVRCFFRWNNISPLSKFRPAWLICTLQPPPPQFEKSSYSYKFRAWISIFDTIATLAHLSLFRVFARREWKARREES